MSSIFDKSDNQTITNRINSLSSDSTPLWGKMSVDQMLKHVNETIIVSFGERQLKIPFVFKFLGKMIKKKVINSKFKRNGPTAKEYIFVDHYDFDEAKSELIKNFNRFTEGHQTIKLMNHPLFGKMSYEDWDKLMWNHTTHHLEQFGV